MNQQKNVLNVVLTGTIRMSMAHRNLLRTILRNRNLWKSLIILGLFLCCTYHYTLEISLHFRVTKFVRSSAKTVLMVQLSNFNIQVQEVILCGIKPWNWSQTHNYVVQLPFEVKQKVIHSESNVVNLDRPTSCEAIKSAKAPSGPARELSFKSLRSFFSVNCSM